MNRAITMTDERRAELLAIAHPEPLHQLADEALQRLGHPDEVPPPETGLIMMQIREPVCRDRFQLGEVVATRATVKWRGEQGWAMRLGADGEAALAAALCDAAAQIDHDLRGRIDELCERTEQARRDQRADEWQRISATRVNFEELD